MICVTLSNETNFRLTSLTVTSHTCYIYYKVTIVEGGSDTFRRKFLHIKHHRSFRIELEKFFVY